MSSPTKSPMRSTDDKLRILSSAKINFLNSTTEQKGKSPVKRSSTPSPDKSKHLKESLLSPVSLKKAGLGSPPKKKPKLWKSKWQLATLSGGFTDTGKKKRATEASRLLDDEGVIHMLNRVPSVYGEVPVSSSSSGGSRIHRARTAAPKLKPRQQPRSRQTKPERTKIKEEPLELELEQVPTKPSHNLVSPRSIKIETNPPTAEIKDIKTEDGLLSSRGPEGGLLSPRGAEGGLLSPRRASRNPVGALHADLRDNLAAVQSEDYFTYLRELPAELLESVMNCDIRYSLPSQGLPVPTPLTKPSPTKPKPSPSSTKPGPSSSRSIADDHTSSRPRPEDTGPVSRWKDDDKPRQKPRQEHPSRAGPVPDRLHDLRACMTAERASPVKSPGAFSEVYVRLYESFAQVTIAPSRTRLTGSLSPTTIEEIIQLLNFVASTRMYKAVILTGVGGVFCQGVDLLYLCNDNLERRRELANQLAAGVERLVLALSSFPKVLVAAVNGVTSGLGLALLPLCDIVYANEKATFNSFSSRLGYIPEGGASISLSRTPPSSLLNELFIFGRYLSSTELRDVGLVSEVFLAGRLMEETIPRVRSGCNASNLGMQWNKILLKQNLKSQLESCLPAETELLAELWSGKEFYRNLVHFINNDHRLIFQKPS